MSAHFKLSRWYCAHCALHPMAEGWGDELSVKTHIHSSHDIVREKAEKGEDYFEGWQARLVYLRRSSDAEQESRKAARFLVQANYTVADFLTDAGDEPWPALGAE